MSWTETSAGHWERPLGLIEKVPLVVSAQSLRPGRENWYETMIAKVSFDPILGSPADALRNGWKQMRYAFPEIAASVRNGIYVYEVPTTPAAVEDWLAETCVVVQENLTADEFMQSLPPSKFMTLHFLPHTSEVIMSSSHFRLDGPAFMVLFNYLTHAMAKPEPYEFGTEPANLAPSFEVSASVPQAPYTPEIEAAAMSRLMAFSTQLPPVTLKPTYSLHSPAGVSGRATLTISTSESKAIITACKAHALTVNMAQHSALVSAVVALEGPTPAGVVERAFSAIAAFGLRKYCIATTTRTVPSGGAAATIASSGNVYPIMVTDGSFHSHATQLKEIYAQGFDAFLPSMSCAQEKMLPMLEKPMPAEMPGQTDPVMSGLGVVDRMIASEVRNETGEIVLRVEDFWVGMEILQRAPQLFFWTWKGQLVWTVCYNEAYWSKADMNILLEETKRQLIQGLGIVDLGEDKKPTT
ncbi:uncharacterized protein BP5553_06815 [Venustampulla echinocandica]|uniref:Uncharacterized protein n=1 Tax=Venustampulla echinocandica TaxID=2656787 RepID=A0A370TL03_9HELO|nr:uncharacterized protein BP5553_06815 [Venustampulla echinocandica]RDL36203.1 hypothetical protein BP5553_06815 [Venustampulla echinocandica]